MSVLRNIMQSVSLRLTCLKEIGNQLKLKCIYFLKHVHLLDIISQVLFTLED